VKIPAVLLLLASVSLLPLHASPASAKAEAAETVSNNSLVRVNSTDQAWDFIHPWAKKAPFLRRGLGVVLPDQKVLVTAELVANHTYIDLEKGSSGEKCPAEVAVVDYDSNLALLKPSNPDFLKDAKPLSLDTGARVGDKVSVLQLENTGSIADTPATITTITTSPYPLDHLALLVYRLSLPLQNRDGSFTVPALRNGKLLGLLMRYDSRTQTAEVIPSPVVAHFLEDAKLSKYPGFPRAGIGFSSTRDPQLRRYIGLKEGGGVYLTIVRPGGPAEKAGLRKGDVVVALNGKPLDQDGNYEDPTFGKISFSHLTNTVAHVGDKITFTVLRDGKRQDIPVTLESVAKEDDLSPPYYFDQQPRYYILGGLVFLELSRPYLQEWGGNWMKDAPQRLVYLDVFQDEQPSDDKKVVFLSQVLPTPNTIGYENLENIVVTKVNGKEIDNLDDLAKAVGSPKDGFHKIEFEEDPGFISLDAAEVENGKRDLMQSYNIPALQDVN